MIGILGGTFDPIHYGHLRLAQDVADSLQLSEVRLIPTGNPWHRAPPFAAPEHRLEMVRLGIAGNTLFRLDDREVRLAAPGYTVETLAGLRQELGASRPLCLLLGADAFAGLPSWHRWKEIFPLTHLAVVARPGAELDATGFHPELLAEMTRRQCACAEDLQATPGGCIFVQPYAPLDISATRIRDLLKAGLSPRYLLPDCVLDYIHAHQLYL